MTVTVTVKFGQTFAGVLVHRATRPLRGSVPCGSGWSVPCVSIPFMLILHQTFALPSNLSSARRSLAHTRPDR
jgi:hypothetical protein